MRWQKRVRLVVALFGAACLLAIYAAIGERQSVAQLPPPERMDPKAILESVGAQVQQERGAERDYDVTSSRQLVYENGLTKLIGVEISVRGRAGRDFTLVGEEAQAGDEQKELQLQGNVRLSANDGFSLFAQRASFSESDDVVRAPGEVRFQKGRMTGEGVDLTYDQSTDVITLHEGARITMKDEGGEGEEASLAIEFSAGAAVLDRAHDALTLEGDVHVYRRGQVFVADRAVARMTPNEDAVTFLELRGNARVEGGGGALNAMSARDIDLDYTDDGDTLERVVLKGKALVGLAGRTGRAGRQMGGDTLDLLLNPDGALRHAIGTGGVQLTLPPVGGSTGHQITAKALDASGDAGGLTAVQFVDDVAFREDRPGAAPRTARSTRLQLALDGDALGSARFSGNVRFDERGLQASGAEAHYQPGEGALRITGADRGDAPHVADERITVEARAIDVTLDSRRMTAAGNVRTTMQTTASGTSKMPGLLESTRPANVKADAMQYEGGAGKVVYTGAAELWQGDTTAVRGDTITLDQQRGDLLVVGAARSDILLGEERSVGRAAEIRYEEAGRTIKYGKPIEATLAGRGRGGLAVVPPVGTTTAVAAGPALLSGPQGDLRGERIEVVLGARGGAAERLEAYTNVSARIGTRAVTGDRLTYYAADERYVIASSSALPVRVVDGCRESSGKTLTFFKSADRIIVDGNEEIRTQTKSGAPCAAAPPVAR